MQYSFGRLRNEGRSFEPVMVQVVAPCDMEAGTCHSQFCLIMSVPCSSISHEYAIGFSFPTNYGERVFPVTVVSREYDKFRRQ